MPDPKGTIEVTVDSTEVLAEGFDPGERVHAHIEWLDETGDTTWPIFNVDGNTKVKADGSVTMLIGIGTDWLERFSERTYGSAKARIWDDNLEIET